MGKIETHKNLDVHPFKTYKSWLVWLEKNHRQTEGVWIKHAKKHTGLPTISYEDSREGAIRYGWIDGLINSLDDQFYLRKFTPRRPKSNWSKINREIAETLIEKNSMKPAGIQQVMAAKKDGRWEAAYDSPSTITVPPELQKLIDSDKTATTNFKKLSSANRYAFLYRIQNAKRPETKQKHIDKAFEMLKTDELYHPQTRKRFLTPTTPKKKK